MAPDRLGLRLHTSHCVKNRDGTVKHAKRALDFHSEVHVARRVNDVDLVTIPFTGRGSRRNGDTALLFLDHPVHRRGAFVYFTDLVVLTGVIKNAFGRGGLTGVDVRHDANVANFVEGEQTGHEITLC